MPPSLFYPILFVLGLLFGSFLSAAIYRIHNKKPGLIGGSSMCPKCQKRLLAHDLIPLLSYIWLFGKCRHCKRPISWYYPALELTTALVFITVGAFHLAPLPLYLFYALVLVFIFFYDLLYMEVPDQILIPAIVIAGLGLFYPGIMVGPKEALIGAGGLTVFFLLQILISKGKWLGGGDLRIGLFMGLILGWKLVLLATFLAYLLGSIISIGLLLSGKVTRKTMVPFGPFLVLGTFVALFYGDTIISWYLNFVLART
ncbi:MAG: prepilin peptidase [Candidatus Gracilibacteria bacterium]